MAETQERGLISYQSRDGQEIKLSFDTVRKYLVSGKPDFVTDQEIILYMGTCKARGLNPFKRDCYLVKYTERDAAAMIVSIDYFRARAKAQDDCVGWTSGIILVDNSQQLEYREGCFIRGGEELVGGWFRAKPRNWEREYTWTVALAPYIKKRADGQITQFWREENQPYMIAKVAESQGLHRLWPDEFQGLTLDDDFNAARDVSTPTVPVRMPEALPQAKEEPPKEPKKERAVKVEPKPVEQTKAEVPLEKTQEDLIQECLLWIEQAPDAEIAADDNFLFATMKKIKGTQAQMVVLKPFNARRQELAQAKTE